VLPELVGTDLLETGTAADRRSAGVSADGEAPVGQFLITAVLAGEVAGDREIARGLGHAGVNLGIRARAVVEARPLPDRVSPEPQSRNAPNLPSRTNQRLRRPFSCRYTNTGDVTSHLEMRTDREV
jgi:hypothetical protein